MVDRDVAMVNAISVAEGGASLADATDALASANANPAKTWMMVLRHALPIEPNDENRSLDKYSGFKTPNRSTSFRQQPDENNIRIIASNSTPLTRRHTPRSPSVKSAVSHHQDSSKAQKAN